MTWIHDFDDPPPLPATDLVRLLGGKGANLAVMANELGLPVPPGFTVTTEACREYLAGSWPAGLDDELREHMDRLGSRVGRRFGDPADPLLVSVRSGAPVSMPGMMDTILDLGLTDETVSGFARGSGSADFAADCRRRLTDGWRAVIADSPVPDDPWLQLRSAVEAVFKSWNSDRAKAYRRREGIADDLGTAVTVQAMVFGNRGADSGTGVLFTRNPSTGEDRLYGDVMFDAQGEDVVAGDHAPEPLSALDARLPQVAAELRRHAAVLERHYADLCDVEFTIEGGRLWLLQVRVGKRSPQAALRMAVEMAEDGGFPLTREEAVRRVAGLLADPPRVFTASGDPATPITNGLPASPGVATGGIALTSEAAEAAANAGQSVILVRSETSPEDVAGMARSAGVLTASGGLASHAAVVARGWGIPAVVGAADVRPGEEAVGIGDRTYWAGEVITIDGSTGAVYAGELAGRWEVVPEAATLVAWAREFGVELEAGAQDTDLASRPLDTAASEPTTDDVLRALSIRGVTAPAALAVVLMAGEASVRTAVEQLTSQGLVESTGDGIRLAAAGREAATALVQAEAASLGAGRTAALLDAFHSLDDRMKQIVTAWQIRDVDGNQTLNDHTDGAYDTRILADLQRLHEDTAAWLRQLLPRFSVYARRLSRAAEAACGGDQRYVASPRVDSYHSVWFELHEDLIRLAGKTRTE